MPARPPCVAPPRVVARPAARAPDPRPPEVPGRVPPDFFSLLMRRLEYEGAHPQARLPLGGGQAGRGRGSERRRGWGGVADSGARSTSCSYPSQSSFTLRAWRSTTRRTAYSASDPHVLAKFSGLFFGKVCKSCESGEEAPYGGVSGTPPSMAPDYNNGSSMGGAPPAPGSLAPSMGGSIPYQTA